MNIQNLVSSCLTRRRRESSHTSSSPNPHPHQHTKSSLCISRQKKLSQEPSPYFSRSALKVCRDFQPSINELPTTLYKPTQKTECSHEQIVERLLADRRHKQSKWAQQKSSKEKQLFSRQCTFQPKISSKSKSLAIKTEHSEPEDVCQRLYREGIDRVKLSESLNNLSGLNNKENCPFRPNTNYHHILNQETHNLEPIHKRLEQIIKCKRQHQKQLQDKHDQQNLLSKPTLNPRSQQMIANRQIFKKNILDRVSVYIEEKKRDSELLKQRRLHNELKGCTFQPEINQTSVFSQHFQQRQQNYLKALESKISSRIRRQNSEFFKPKINKISEILTNQRNEETWQEKVNRHALENVEKNRIIGQLEQEVYKQCTFEPKINLISQCLDAKHICHKCDNEPQQPEFEFKPKINKISQFLVKLRRDQGIDLQREKEENKNHNLHQIKMEQEYKEMRECTFKPKINKSSKSVKTTRNVEHVHGFRQFAQRIHKINELKNEEKQREEQLFELQKRYKERKHTQPKQFRLSQGFNHKDTIKEQLMRKFESECTFAPTINQLRQ